MKKLDKRLRRRLIIGAALTALSLLCLLGYYRASHALDSQRAAERWQGDNGMEFAQVTAFLPADKGLTLEQLYTFRNDMATKLKGAALDLRADPGLLTDAWSTLGKAKVQNGSRKGEVSVTAVGGSFFSFHPIKLLSGSYLYPEDLMKDRVLLDEDTAWLLFGGTQLQGMSLTVEGVPFVVAGVFEREDDRFSTAAYSSGMGIYMSYEAYSTIVETASVTCYELVMAQPVKGFVYSAAGEKFPIGSGQLVNNSDRYDAFVLLKQLKTLSARSMHSLAVAYPYWENAARAAEDSCLVFLTAAILLALGPFIMALWAILRYSKLGKRKLENELIPKLKDKTQEAVRVRQRQRWLKRHGEDGE